MQSRRRGSLAVRRPPLWLGVTASLTLALDQLSKLAVRSALEVSEALPVLAGFFEITRIENQGAAFGLLPGKRELFVTISLLMLVGVAIYWLRERPVEWPVIVSLGLVIGGAIGNLIDRAFIGRVTDFLAFSIFAPVFNIADSGIVVGVAGLIGWILFGTHGEHGVADEEAGSGMVDADDRGADTDDDAGADADVDADVADIRDDACRSGV